MRSTRRWVNKWDLGKTFVNFLSWFYGSLGPFYRTTLIVECCGGKPRANEQEIIDFRNRVPSRLPQAAFSAVRPVQRLAALVPPFSGVNAPVIVDGAI